MTSSQQAEYLDLIRDGVRRGQAAERIGLSRSAVAGFVAENASFEAAVVEAEGAALELVEEALFQAAISGNIVAAKTWIELDGRRRKRRGVPTMAQPSTGNDDDPDSELQEFLDGLR